MFKSGFVTIIGRPNVGKSTLLNHIMGEKLSIVSSKPQTTRNNIQTILTGEEYQIVFVDTPGMHNPRHKLGEYMVKVAKESMNEVDVALFVTTPDVEVKRGDLHILEQLKSAKVPVFLVVNKIDETTEERLAATLKNYSEAFEFQEIIPISAQKGKNVDKLIELMVKHLNEGPKYYPDDMIIDKQERFIIAEIIREKALRFLSQEVPHGIAVEILQMKEENEKYKIEATIMCEKDSHKGIIIGKGGEMLKKISQSARKSAEKFLDKRVNMKIWVKVKKDWRDSPFVLGELGYKAPKK
ncbi:GTP-binding protein Era [Clostridium acetobutylicum]|uniref:GTPase Era n=1 Tax=Clostridium acetobutylicum (strain ATCC 824 / DSM 792 / JCM 1419 / IAM 19013 / LMG 5710 / NBRC 13948 / NRRL B-527 / VKM B-1787 / 2291 / W) TaxID=272562 RepID=ERA_CLOAB|nr:MULTISPECIES: GTPase Era [Clostridium]Q97JI5.1 RecName: Full=GTPase Era [Clostridium acetobutylicum ATCC 824]AAK79266.1 ERA GTPase [Clostridium acetobutylicum ATCC 824]ADZ20345.1 GTP-binding protein Era [Clostridium acetobutylicum EA 2018]AEI33239.1 GTP-binding protein Era [Clostridium acetobutylicum DSM 1731]AWV81487.1 GTPase Era [Clostridium acetobutylicum]KHD35166.1 GTPase Era [Clostridium acetobutylicum]